MTDEWHTTPDGREALSLAHGAHPIGVLRLSSGRYAIYNDIRELQGIVDSLDPWPPACWTPRVRKPLPETRKITEDDLRELGIL